MYEIPILPKPIIVKVMLLTEYSAQACFKNTQKNENGKRLIRLVFI